MQKTSKRRAPRTEYTSQNQLSFTGFETPFYNGLDPENRWVVLSSQIPLDELVLLFNKRNPPKKTGRPALNPRVLIGAVIIKHLLNLDDRETVLQFGENMYLQYFLGYSSYIKRAPFDASLFVDIRKRLGMNRIRARLKNTSQSWIASIILVLNLVKLAGMAQVCPSFSAWEWLNESIKSSFKAFLRS